MALRAHFFAVAGAVVAVLRCNLTNGNPVLEMFKASCTFGPPK